MKLKPYLLTGYTDFSVRQKRLFLLYCVAPGIKFVPEKIVHPAKYPNAWKKTLVRRKKNG